MKLVYIDQYIEFSVECKNHFLTLFNLVENEVVVRLQAHSKEYRIIIIFSKKKSRSVNFKDVILFQTY